MTSAQPEQDPVPEPLPPEEADLLEPDVPHTGVSVVDDVIASLGNVDEQPLEERVQAFERVQDGLRGALDEDSRPDRGDPGV